MHVDVRTRRKRRQRRPSAATSAKERTSSASSRTACTRTLSSPIGVPLRDRPSGRAANAASRRPRAPAAPSSPCARNRRSTSSAAPGIMAAISSCCASGLHASCRPQSTTDGQRIACSTAPASGRARSASICAANWSGVCRSIMSRIASINRLSARRAGCTMGSAQTRPIARMPLSRASASRRRSRRALVLAADARRERTPARIEQAQCAPRVAARAA